jgi:hypothetical protein
MSCHMDVEQHHNIKLCNELLATSGLQSCKNDESLSASVLTVTHVCFIVLSS